MDSWDKTTGINEDFVLSLKPSRARANQFCLPAPFAVENLSSGKILQSHAIFWKRFRLQTLQNVCSLLVTHQRPVWVYGFLAQPRSLTCPTKTAHTTNRIHLPCSHVSQVLCTCTLHSAHFDAITEQRSWILNFRMLPKSWILCLSFCLSFWPTRQ